MGKLDIALRKVHKREKVGEIGTLAGLHDILVKRGFSYQYKAGEEDYFMTGKAVYEDPLGTKALLRRIEKGKPARWLPPAKRATGVLVKVRTAATRDVWQLIMGKKRKR